MPERAGPLSLAGRVRESALPLGLFILGMIAAGWLGAAVEGRLARQAEERFQKVAEDVTRAVEAESRRVLADLTDVAAYATATRPLVHTDFHAFMVSSGKLSARPGVRAVAYAPHLTEASLGAYLNRLRFQEPARLRDGYPPFALTPPGPRADYFPAVMVEPPASRPGVVGYDLAANPDRLDAARRAFETGQPQASAPVSLSQDESSGLLSVLLTAPVYRAGALEGPHLPVWADLRAVVAMGYTPGLGLDRILPPDLPPGLAFTLYGDGTPDQVLHDHPAFRLPADPAGGLKGASVPLAEADMVRQLPFAGRLWTLAFGGLAEGRDPVSRATPYLLGAGAGMVALLLALLSATVIGEGRRLKERVAERTAALSAANRELDARRREAESANKAKSDFLALMSHELRTPLTAILGFSEMIRDQRMGPIGSDLYSEYAADIHKSGSHLLELVSDILDLARIEAGRGELAEEAVDLGDLVGQAARLLDDWAGRRGLELEVIPPAAPLVVRGDRRKLKQVVFNLLSNGIKFTPEGGRVSVHTGIDPQGQPELRVVDSGIGMSGDEVRRAIEPFTQIDSVLSRTVEGTGLGLPLVRALVGLHGGTFHLQSEPGAGTTAVVCLPAWRRAPDLAADQTEG